MSEQYHQGELVGWVPSSDYISNPPPSSPPLPFSHSLPLPFSALDRETQAHDKLKEDVLQLESSSVSPSP